MNLYIVRHGVAAELDNEIVEEGYRYLTVAGRNHCRVVAIRLKDMKPEIDLIISSPLVRAVQTAEVFASVLKYDGEVRTAIELVGGATFPRFKQLLNRYSHHKNIMLVGHAPDVNNFSLSLIDHEDVKELKLGFKNSSVCKINYHIDKGAGEFEWFLESESMKMISAPVKTH